MIDVLNVLIAGARDGSLYGLLALAIVLIYKSTGVINFALPNIGMVGVAALQSLVNSQVPPLAAFILALLAAILLGLAVERLAFRPVQQAPSTTRMIVSLAAATLIGAVVSLLWGNNRAGVVTFPFFDTAPFTLGDSGILVAPLDLAACALCLVLAGMLYLFFRATTIGIAVRACAERPASAALFGVEPQRIGLLSWTCGSMLTAVAACFFAASQGAVSPNLMDAALVWALLSAALGSLTSLWGALAGGVLLGMADQGLQLVRIGWLDGSLYHRPALFIALIAVLMVRRHGLFGDRRVRQV